MEGLNHPTSCPRRSTQISCRCLTYSVKAACIDNLGQKTRLMSCVICSFLILLYLICNVLPGFDFLCAGILACRASASLLSRWRQTWVNILAVKSDSTKGPHGYAKTAQILWWDEISAAVITLANTRDAAKLRSCCLQCSAAVTQKLQFVTRCCRRSATSDSGSTARSSCMDEISVLPTPIKTTISVISFFKRWPVGDW